MNNQEVAEQLNVFSSYLRREGLKMTRQRELVVLTFLTTDGHLSAEQLYEEVKRKDPKIGLATIFRTLKTLTNCGLARELNLGDGRSRYEHDYKRPKHYHLVCDDCGRTIEFFSPEFENLADQVVEKYRFEPRRRRLQIFGICPSCRGEKAEEADSPDFDSDLVFARDALKIAMATEERGVSFYKAAADIATHESTRRTFLEMLEEEKHHFSGLKKEWDQLIEKNEEILDAPDFLHFDYDALKEIFPSAEQVREEMARGLSEVEALKLAMAMELDAYHYFKSYADKFNDTKGRDIFRKFAEEEQEHYELIKKELDRVTAQA